MPISNMSHITPAARLERVRTDDGVSIAYNAAGNGPRTLLALHGWGGAGSGHSWRDVTRHLDLANLKMVALDLRGHGESDRPDAGFTLDRFGRDVLAVADSVGAERFVIVGYSMSGRLAQWISCHYPARVLGQILIAPAPPSVLSLPEELLESWLRDTGDREKFEPWMRQFTSEPLPEEIIDTYFNDVARASLTAKRETFRMCCRDDFSAAVASTVAPTLVIAGNQDPIFSPEFLRQEVVARIAGARLTCVDCGHEIPVERPAQAAALIEAFLAGLRE
jgi:pimeloyl-ACP methyl ester carboxylesterase